VSYSLR